MNKQRKAKVNTTHRRVEISFHVNLWKLFK